MAGISHHLRVAACALAALCRGRLHGGGAASTAAGLGHGGRGRALARSGTTFGELIRDLGLHAAAGRLLSVTGRVLEPRRDPGEILLNGVQDPRSTALTPATP